MNLINKLPSFYDNDITKPIQDSFSVEADNINNKVDETLKQFFVDSATYGLDYWEKMLGISKNNNDIQTRRENIKAKMRSRGTTSIEVIKNICEAYSNGEVENTLNQFYVDSATYGLDYWEKMLGISKNNNDIQTRRENIKAKMRSRGTTSIDVIKNICEAYSNGIVEINVDHSNYSFEIVFVSTIGVPLSFEELDRVINEIKPCHLAHSYKFNYNTHSDISKYTHEELANYTHEEIRNSSELRGDK